MKVILYARCSVEEQATTGVSLDVQQDKLTAYASLYDLEPVAVIVDAGESAKSLNRPGIQEALAMLDNGQADGIVVLKLDRLTRNIANWQTLIDGYFSERAGKQLFSVNESVDTRSASGRMVLNIMLTIAQWERETIGERTSQALQYKISRRQRVGAVLFGYDLAADGHTLEPNATEQAALVTMRELRQSGMKLRAIAAELSARGIKTKQGLANWSHQAVAYILKQDRGAVAA